MAQPATPGAHNIQAHLLDDVKDVQNGEAVGHPQHGAGGEDGLVIIRHLPVEIPVIGLKPFPRKTNMDAAHRAAGAGRIPEEGRLGEALAGDAVDVVVLGGLEVAPGKGFLFVQDRHVYRGAQVVVLLHHVGGGKFLVDRLKELGVIFALHEREAAIPDDDDGLEVLGPQGGATAHRAKMAVGVYIDARHGALLLSCRADSEELCGTPSP